MAILTDFDLGAFMSTPDLPLYGQLFAYGIGLAGFGFGLKQIVSALDLVRRWFLKNGGGSNDRRA